jgi:hypothetical protein
MSSSELPLTTKCEKGLYCPSACCEEGAILLGIVGVDGVIGYVTPQMTVDTDFCRAAQQGRKPETRFRFAQPCVENQCIQWTGSCCGLIHQVLESSEGVRITGQSPEALPQCVIRSSCRWFAQAGTQACAVCPVIIHSPDRTALLS